MDGAQTRNFSGGGVGGSELGTTKAAEGRVVRATAGDDSSRDPLGDDAAAVDPPSAPALDFDIFCRAEFKRSVALAYVLTGSWAVAEDLAQDAFLDAFRLWDRVGAYDLPGAWIKRVVVNRSASWRRRRGRESNAIDRLRGRYVESQAPTATDDELWSTVRRLSKRQAQILALTYVDDLSLEQVARVLGISEGTVKTHLQRGRAALSVRLGTPTGSVESTSGDEP